MKEIERMQILTEVVSEFKTAILMDHEADKTGRLVLEVIQESGDDMLSDHVLSAFLKLSDQEASVRHLDDATKYLHNKIDLLMQQQH